MRHLKPVQIYGRVWFHAVRPKPDLRAAPPVRAVTGPWVSSPVRPCSIIAPDVVRLLGREAQLADRAAWSSPEHPRLWLYNLHYFDDLAAPADSTRRAWQRGFVARWIAENPPAEGPGWEPYPTSLRIVNWVKWSRAGVELTDDAVASLAVQARWLRSRIEHHLLANHLFVNAKALVVAGLFFDGPEASAWREAGLAIIRRELPEQVQADGGHYEGSPMYHALMLEDLLDLINLATSIPGVVPAADVTSWRSTAARMAPWLRAMTHPDGEIAFFNDAAMGVAPTADALDSYAAALDIPRANGALSDSGYVRAERTGAVLIADVAPVGPDYQPGHAHADTLSFELSLNAHRVFVNCGTSTYDVGQRRDRERSTAAHTTVTIDEANSSDVWGAFRVARRARATCVERHDADGTFTLRGAHDGYRHRVGHPTHERTWEFAVGQLVITDRCAGATKAVARYHLHPDVHPEADGLLRLPDGSTARWTVIGGTASVVPSEWSRSFNEARATTCIEVSIDRDESRMELRW
ncbi:MAG TPA: alginate lyase family protein [Gemmatimonadaceae bacterium]|nr:alginate lyase family protein [Gemmatimonadaceae bacterium]